MPDSPARPLLDRVAMTALLGGVLAVVAAGCLIPGQLYPVAPAVRGQIADFTPGSEPTKARLVLIHRDVPTIHANQEVPVDENGRFAFDAVQLELAGREYTKLYRFYLHLIDAEGDRVIWRAQRSRRATSQDIELDCDLARPRRQGQRCQVIDAVGHDWLVSEGERAYQRLCASCHAAPGAEGRESRRGAIGPPPDLAGIAARNGGRFDRRAVAARIAGESLLEEHREGAMPVWGERLSTRFERYAEGDELVGATLDPIVAYLESVQLDGGTARDR